MISSTGRLSILCNLTSLPLHLPITGSLQLNILFILLTLVLIAAAPRQWTLISTNVKSLNRPSLLGWVTALAELGEKCNGTPVRSGVTPG